MGVVGRGRLGSGVMTRGVTAGPPLPVRKSLSSSSSYERSHVERVVIQWVVEEVVDPRVRRLVASRSSGVPEMRRAPRRRGIASLGSLTERRWRFRSCRGCRASGAGSLATPAVSLSTPRF